MAKTIQEEFLYKKVYEFSYATFMVASSLKSGNVAELLENKGILLLDSVISGDYGKTKDLVHSITNLLGFVTDAGIMHPSNREVLVRESEKIYLAIEALPKRREELPNLNLERVFSKSILPNKRQVADKQFKRQSQSEIADNGAAGSTPIRSEVRQSAIIGKLRQIGNCRLSDLQTIFPDISERTLRYDIESLISRGSIERIGSRRNSVYRIRNQPAGPIELPAHSMGMPDAQGYTPGSNQV